MQHSGVSAGHYVGMRDNTVFDIRYRSDNIQHYAEHYHDFYEIFFPLSGNLTYSVENQDYTLTPNTLLLIAPSERHQPRPGPDIRIFERIALYVSPLFVLENSTPQTDLSACFQARLPFGNRILPLNYACQKHTFDIMKHIYECSQRDAREYGVDIDNRTYLLQLLTEINRIARGTSACLSSLDRDQELIRNVTTFIESNYRKELTLSRLAGEFFVDKSRLANTFSRLVGMPPHRYIVLKRLNAAMQLLGQGLSPTAVAEECGFGCYTSFYRLFMQERHQSPKEYQYRLLNGEREHEGE